jgi:hypothetical protein
MSTRLFNEKLMRKEKGESSQTIETTLLAQKYFESKRSMRDKNKNICNYCKKVDHWAKDCKKKKFDAMHKQKTKEGNVIDNEV